MSFKAYLQLVRLPNLFTAAADSLAGWLLVTGSFDHPRRWLPLLGASMSIYAAGIVLNDLFDLEVDRKERPSRPLPSGRVSTRFAGWLGGGFLALGVLLAVVSGSWISAVVALVLVACVVGYDAGLKHTPIGPEVMGVCRGLNVLLGMSQAAELGGPAGCLVAASMALFVTGVTWISRNEVMGGRTPALAAGLTFQNVAIAGLIAIGFLGSKFPNPSPGRPLVPIEGLIVLLVVAWLVNAAGSRAVREPTPQRMQLAVKTGVLSLVWLNVGIVAAVRGLPTALAVAALWVPAYVLAKWLYAT